MLKINKKFKNSQEYYRDYEYITNSHLLAFNNCNYFYKQKRKGRIKEIEKIYFTYGKCVDAILSGENIEDKFFVGTAPKESVEELRECVKVIENEMKEREDSGKKILKTQFDKLDKFNEKITDAQATEGKIAITSTVLGHIVDTAKEIKSQPLYEAFSGADPQIIIATKINGVKVKCMLDKLDLKNGIICDDKTTANMNTFDPEMYLQQLSWYRWIVKEVYGVEADCYLSVGDKVAGFKRSSLYYITPEKLNYQEIINQALLEEFLKAKKDNKYPPCVIGRPDLRQERCFNCDNYVECPHSRQTEFIAV